MDHAAAIIGGMQAGDICDVQQYGFALRRGALTSEQVETLRRLLHPASDPAGLRRRRGAAYAARNLLWECPRIGTVLTRLGLDAIAAEAIGSGAFALNATYFDKTPGANWKVPAHQDLIMPVESEVAEPGYSAWSTKLGVVHVEPPAEVLSKLVALRVHLDDCPATNGALAVVPGSHRHGKLSDAEVTAIPREQFMVCEAARGDVLVMKPLLVHRSPPSAAPAHRRVLHIVYATEEPGEILRWKRSV